MDRRVDRDEPPAPAVVAQVAAEGLNVADVVRLLVICYLATPLADDREWQARWDTLLAQVRAGVPAGVTVGEIEAGITAAQAAVRARRRARGD